MRRLTLVLLVIVLGMTGCASSQQSAPRRDEAVAREVIVEAEMSRPAEFAAPGNDQSSSGEARMVIFTSQLGIVVDDTAAVINEIKGIVASLGGYVSSSTTWFEGDPENEQLRGRMTVRVPSESLDDTLSRIKGLANQVRQEELSGEDVTEEYTDLGARLRNLEATETELRELLREVRENRGEADEILKVHQRLTEIRGEIERLKGRMQYLERSAALARVDIEIYPEETKKPVVDAPGFQPGRIIRNAARAFVDTLEVLAGVVIWLVIFSPVIAIPVVIVLLIRRGRRRRRAARAKAAAEKADGEAQPAAEE